MRSPRLIGLVLFTGLSPSTLAAQTSPTSTPVLLAPGQISRHYHEFTPALAPDGALYFTLTDGGFTRMTLLVARPSGSGYGTPDVLPFSGVWNDGDLALSPDGTTLVFMSNRPVDGGNTPKADFDLWMVRRATSGRWGTPERLPPAINTDTAEVYPSLARDGTLYFGRNRRFYRVRQVNGVWQAPELLPFGGFSFAIDPDQRYAVIGAPGASPTDLDLHVVRRNGETWDTPRRLEAPINSSGLDMAGSIAPDGRTLLFVSTRRETERPTWPRARPVRSAAEVESELGAIYNGLRNIFRVTLDVP